MPEAKLDQLEVRSHSCQLSVALLQSSQKPFTTEMVVEEAQKLEKYIWGRFAPMEKAPTPLSTIAEAANATAQRISEYAVNCGDEERKKKILAVADQWNRFMADLTAAMAKDG